MPVLKKEIELDDGSKVLVRQVSGLERLALDAKQARVFRSMREFGANPLDWSEDQQMQFAEALDEADCGPAAQIANWVPLCILSENVDVNDLTSSELQEILRFVRGDDEGGGIPLSSS
jgi:hypothetical protein